MPRVLVVYHSRSGNTEKMAQIISEAISGEGVDVVCKKVQDTNPDELLEFDGIIVGSPTYYGIMSAEIKKFIDESNKHHGKLEGKVGGAFASAAATGQETTVLSILETLLIHGMIIQGDFRGHHYGATSVGKPGDIEIQRWKRFGQRAARLVKQLFG